MLLATDGSDHARGAAGFLVETLGPPRAEVKILTIVSASQSRKLVGDLDQRTRSPVPALVSP